MYAKCIHAEWQKAVYQCTQYRPVRLSYVTNKKTRLHCRANVLRFEKIESRAFRFLQWD